MSTEMWSWAHIYRAILVPSSQPMPSLTVPGFRPGTENSREVTRVFSDRWDFHGNYRVDDGMHRNYRVVLRKSSSCQRRIYGNCRVLPESRLTRFSPLTQSTPRALLPSRLFSTRWSPSFYKGALVSIPIRWCLTPLPRFNRWRSFHWLIDNVVNQINILFVLSETWHVTIKSASLYSKPKQYE